MDPVMDIAELRQFLLQVPAKYNYEHSNVVEMRDDLRATLFRFATAGGRYANLLFDGDSQSAIEHRMRSRLPPQKWIEHSSPGGCGYRHPGRPCARKLGRGEPTHRCLTCGLDDTCALCKYCFNPADHEGHNVFVKVSSRDDGGICDCGDSEAWTKPLNCLTAEQDSGIGDTDLPPAFVSALRLTLAAALDYCIDVMAAAHPGLPFLQHPYQLREAARDSELIPEIYHSTQDLPGDGKYVLQMWHDDKRSYTDCYADVQLATERPLHFAVMIGRRLDQFGRAIIAMSSNLDRLLDQKSRVKHFACTIRTTRDYIREEMADEIIRWIYDLTQCECRNAEPMALTHLVGEALLAPWTVGTRSQGRITGMRQTMAALQPAWTHSMLQGTRIPSVEMRADTLAGSSVPTGPSGSGESELALVANAEQSMDTTPAGTPPVENTGATEPATNNALVLVPTGPLAGTLDDPEPTGQRIIDLIPDPQQLWVSPEPGPDSNQQATRVKYLIFFDIRLWKSVRSVLNDLYVSALIADLEHKPRLGQVYADIHQQMAECFVLLDREPEISALVSLSTQLFTTPSIATSLMRSSLYTHYLAAFYTLFTESQVSSPSSIQPGPMTLSTPMFRNRRLVQVFHDFEYLLIRNTDKRLVAGNPRRILQMADFLSLFQSLMPIHRQTDKHVEYESESWVYYFTTVPQVLQLGHAVAQGVLGTPLDEALPGIRAVAQALLRWSTWHVWYLGALPGRVRQNQYISGYAGITVQRDLSSLSVANDAMSLHHPVNAYLSWLVEYARFPTIEMLKNTLLGEAPVLAAAENAPVQLVESLLFDYNVRTMAFLSQIYVGLWVRNGYTVRSQLHHYRESTLRDLAYARDVYMVQLGLVCLDANTAFLQLLHRWNMADWLHDPLFDEHQRWYMLEEFLHTLTFLVVDRVQLQGWNETESRERAIEREIVQCLAFSDLSYSELVKLVPETMAADQRFDVALYKCATFTPPRGLRDVGMYSLKTELLPTFDPHFTYFSAARIEEAEHAIIARLTKTGQMPADGVHLPPLLPLRGPWTELAAFTRSVAFARFIYDLLGQLLSFHNVQQAEGVMSKTLHLLLIAALEDVRRSEQDQDDSSKEQGGLDHAKSVHQDDGDSGPRDVFETVAQMVAVPEGPQGTSIGYQLRRVLGDPAFKSLQPRVHKLFELLHRKDPRIEVPLLRKADANAEAEARGSDNATSEEDEAARKKRMGKAVQQRMLEEFRKRQQLFMQNSGVDSAPSEDEASEEEDSPGFSYPTGQCVLCRMPDDADSIFGLMTYTSTVRILRDLPAHSTLWQREAYRGPSSLDVEHPGEPLATDDVYGPAFPTSHTHLTPSVQGCGHGVHYKCFVEFQQDQQQRALAALRFCPENYAKGEFLCPLCRGLNNCFMPVLWTRNNLAAPTYLEPAQDMFGDATAFLGIRRPHEPHDGFVGTVSAPQENLTALVEAGLNGLSPRFVDAVLHQDFSECFPSEVRTVILTQMLRVKDAAAALSGRSAVASDGTDLFGLQHIFRAVSGTVATTEVALRGQKHSAPQGGLIVDQLPAKTAQFLRVFVKYVTTLSGFIVNGCLRLHADYLECSLSDPLAGPADPFTKLVECLIFAAPVYGVKPSTILRSILGLAVAQALQHLPELEPSALASTVNSRALPEITSDVATELGKWTSANPQQVWPVLERHITIFLRRAAILIYSFCGAYDPDDFAFKMGLAEHERLASYLAVPALSELILNLSKPTPEGLAARQVVSRGLVLAPLPYPGIYRLLKLPHRLDTFFNLPGEQHVLPDPAVCLFCGDIVATQSLGTAFTRLGACNRHLTQCTQHYGIFLLPRRNMVLLLLPDGRGTFVPAPYLDVHGEPDESMRRMRPQFLQQLRYDALARSMWLENGLVSTTLRKLDQSADNGGWETL